MKVLFLTLSFFFITVFAYSQGYYVVAKDVNLRNKADKNSKVIKLLPVNAKVTRIKDENPFDEWVKVKYQGRTGYMHESFLSKNPRYAFTRMD